jgi:hypothetical protein
MPNDEFEKFLVEAIDESLSSLGESPKQSILFHLENTFKIKKQEISNNIDGFDDALKKTFGPGAHFLETLIINKLCEKAYLPFKGLPHEEAGFSEILLAVRRLMEK